MFALIGYLRRLKPDIVHTHMAKAGVIGRIAAVLARVPVRVHTYHGHLLHGYFSPIVTRLFTTAERCLRIVTTHALVVGAATRRDLLQAHVVREQKSSTILPAARALNRHEQRTARASLGLPADGLIVGFVGRLTGIKR
ncbi:MAG: glycosyltransferase, partial [Actinomycetota bacterium]